MHSRMSSISAVVTIFILFLIISQVVNAQQSQVFTQDSIAEVNQHLREKDLQMVVVTVIANETQQPVDYIYLVVWDSLLFLKPYVRLYTMFTITQKVDFATLETMPGIVKELGKGTSHNNLSNYALAMINETNVLEYKPNPKYDQLKLCTLIANGAAEHLYPNFFCLNLLTNSTQAISASSMLDVQDAILTLLQISCVIAVVYYINSKLYQIKRAGKHRYVADTLFNPPYWSYILPWISRKTKTNFRLWDSIWIGLVFLAIYALSVFSSFVPLTWPLHNREPYITNLKRYMGMKEIRFLILMLVVIIVNMVTSVQKIYRNATRENHVDLPLKFNKLLIMSCYIVAILLSCTSIAIIALFMIFVFPESFTITDKVVYGISTSLFGVSLMIHFCKKSTVTISNMLYKRISQRYGKAKRQKEKQDDFDDQYQLLQSDSEQIIPPISTSVIFLVMLGSWIITAMWNTSLIILCFRASKVISKLFTATLANILLNTEMITTYSYILSIVGVFWKFTVDIERPYLRLKNMIAKERGSLSLPRIMGTNKRLRTYTLNELKSDLFLLKERFYFMPLRWTTYAKLTEMTYLPKMTREVFFQMLITLFALCLFWIASRSYDTKFFSKITDQSWVALIAGTVMPLIPRLISYFSGNEDGMDSTIFNERLKNSLKLLERRAENNTKEKFDWNVPSAYVPFRFIIVSVVKEPDAQTDDDDDDIPLLLSKEFNIPLQTMKSTEELLNTSHADNNVTE